MGWIPRALLASLLLASLGAGGRAARADSWPAPAPVSFHARGFGMVAEVFPPRSRQNPTDRPQCFFYEVAYPGTMWTVAPTLRWEGPLANERMPAAAVVSMEGELVTLDEYANQGFRHAVVIYDAKGALVRSWALEELLSAEELAALDRSADRSVSSRWWRRAAELYFMRDPGRFYVVPARGRTLEFALSTGALRAAPRAAFPALVRPDVNARVEVWATSLRFSSITDLLRAPGR